MSEHIPIDRACQEAFADVLAQRPDDAARLSAMVATAVQQAAAPTAVAAGSGKLVGIAIAVVTAGALAWGIGRASPRDDVPVADAPLEPTLPHQGALDGAGTPTSESSAARATVAEVVPDRTPAEPRVTAPAVARSRPGASASASKHRAPPTIGETSPDDLLKRANEARRRDDFTAADRLYAELRRDHADSRAATVGCVSHGRLLLEQLDRADDALAAFDRYLARSPEGHLAEEARLGRARALAKLGRREQSAAAWGELLERHPESLHAETARRELRSP